MTPSFLAGQQTGTNFSNSFRKVNDENAIQSILADAMKSGNPEDLQKSIGQILSKVSPERQGAAVQYLQNAYKNVVEKQKMQKQEAQANEYGIPANLPPALQAEIYKQNQKNQRLNQYGLGGDPNSNYNLPNAKNGTTPQLEGVPNAQNSQQIPSQVKTSSPFQRLTDDQLVSLTGAPDKELSEPAKAELKRRADEKKVDQKQNQNWTKFGMDRAKKVLDRAEEIAQALPVKNTALKLMNESIAGKNLSFFSPDNLAEITGIEAFRSPEGSLFKTAAKEYFLGNISRAGARPNQWIEQQIADMMTKIGRSTEANLSVSRALQNELDIENERVRLTEEIFDNLRNENKDVGNLGSMVNKELSQFADQKQGELFNDLRAIKSIGENKPQKFKPVEKGTKISSYMVEALLNSFNNDPQKASQEAKKLGYSFE